jgi:DNA-binding response OmpR family regulator
LPKPFKFEELLARIRALLRRPPLAAQDDLLQLGPLELNLRKRRATYDGLPLDLRPKEFSILEDLLRHPEEVISRTVLAERVWGEAFIVSDNVIDVTISGLRQKLVEGGEAHAVRERVRIETVRGIGYRLVLAQPRL